MSVRQDPSPATFGALCASAGSPFTLARYAPRAVIFRQGDASETVMAIESGRVRLAVTTPDGKEGISGLLDAGAFLGEDALGGHCFRRQTATAMTATELVVIAKPEMTVLLHTQPAIEDRFIEHLLSRHARLEVALTDQLLCSTEQRLAHALVELAGCDGRDPGDGVLPHVSQEVIAEMIGTTRSRVSLFMGRFKQRGFIDDAGSGTICVRPALVRIVLEDRGKTPQKSCAVVNRSVRPARVR